MPNKACLQVSAENEYLIHLFLNSNLIDTLSVKAPSKWNHIQMHGHYMWSHGVTLAENKEYVVNLNLIGRFYNYDRTYVSIDSMALLNKISGERVREVSRRSSSGSNPSRGRCRPGRCD